MYFHKARERERERDHDEMYARPRYSELGATILDTHIVNHAGEYGNIDKLTTRERLSFG